MRTLFTCADLSNAGIDRPQLKRLLRARAYTRVLQGVYVQGSEPPTDLECALAIVAATGGVASHWLAATLHGFDSAKLTSPLVSIPPSSRSVHPGVRRHLLLPAEISLVNGVRTTHASRTLLDMASIVDAAAWEHMLESSLRKGLTTVRALESALRTRRRGNALIREVLALRPECASPTESLLETLAIQLIRSEPRLPTPARQVNVIDRGGRQVARVDLAWPDLGVFLELDGQHHKDQPVHDARRETAVVAATGWLPGRFTWHEVTRAPRTTSRRILELLESARRIRQ